MFSDGVFAIALTLLVIELKFEPDAIDKLHHASNPVKWISRDIVLDSELAHQLLHISSKFLSVMLGFLFISSLWFNHNQIFKLLRRKDNSIIWLNNILLLSVALTPFPISLIGLFPTSSIGITLFGILAIINPFLFYLIFKRADTQGYIHEYIDRDVLLGLSRVTLLLGPLSAVPILIAFKWPPVGLAYYVIVSIIGVVVGSRVKMLRHGNRRRPQTASIPWVTISPHHIQ